jgi:hypothetical protein
MSGSPRERAHHGNEVLSVCEREAKVGAAVKILIPQDHSHRSG